MSRHDLGISEKPFGFGIVAGHAPDLESWTALAKRTEERGYDTFLATQHDPLTKVSAALAVTSTLHWASDVPTPRADSRARRRIRHHRAQVGTCGRRKPKRSPLWTNSGRRSARGSARSNSPRISLPSAKSPCPGSNALSGGRSGAGRRRRGLRAARPGGSDGGHPSPLAGAVGDFLHHHQFGFPGTVCVDRRETSGEFEWSPSNARKALFIQCDGAYAAMSYPAIRSRDDRSKDTHRGTGCCRA